MDARVQRFFYAINKEFELVSELIGKFERFESTNETVRKFKQLMTLLPDDEQIDYLVYSASDSITEEKEIWDMRYFKVIKRLMFKKFDSWVEGELIG